MNTVNKYLHFCTKFNNIKLPQIKFKDINDRYKYLYNNLYKIEETTINKASFFIFTSIFISFLVIFIFFFFKYLLIMFLLSFIASIAFSYKFNLFLYNKISAIESSINSSLYLIRTDFAMLQKSLKAKADYCTSFIQLIAHYDIPLSSTFKLILAKIHEGSSPEEELNNLITPSKDFNDYLKGLLLTNFQNDKTLNKIEEKSLEKDLKIHIRQVQNKIAVIFFIGIFFPIGACFFILFQVIEPIYIFLIIPILFLLLHLTYKKFIKIDYFLIGMLNMGSNIERKKFNEFLKFIKNYAINLQQNISPEKAFINAYDQNKRYFNILRNSIRSQISNLVSLSYSFDEIIDRVKNELSTFRYQLILDSIKNMVKENAFYTSKKIIDIINIIGRHKKLEKKLDIIIQGEKFKIFIFLTLLPTIIGAIGGMFPFYTLLGHGINLNQDVIKTTILGISNINTLLSIFFTLMTCVVITSYYFLKIINKEAHFYLIFIILIEYTILFFISYSTIITLF